MRVRPKFLMQVTVDVDEVALYSESIYGHDNAPWWVGSVLTVPKNGHVGCFQVVGPESPALEVPA